MGLGGGSMVGLAARMLDLAAESETAGSGIVLAVLMWVAARTSLEAACSACIEAVHHPS